MPKAVVDIDETTRHELKTCEGGFVVLRRLPYGSWLKRQEMALQMKLKGGDKNNDAEAQVAMANRKVTEFEFKECIVEHNLQGHDDSLLNFNYGTTLDALNPKIGNEIATYISQLHEFDLGN